MNSTVSIANSLYKNKSQFQATAYELYHPNFANLFKAAARIFRESEEADRDAVGPLLRAVWQARSQLASALCQLSAPELGTAQLVDTIINEARRHRFLQPAVEKFLHLLNRVSSISPNPKLMAIRDFVDSNNDKRIGVLLDTSIASAPQPIVYQLLQDLGNGALHLIYSRHQLEHELFDALIGMSPLSRSELARIACVSYTSPLLAMFYYGGEGRSESVAKVLPGRDSDGTLCEPGSHHHGQQMVTVNISSTDTDTVQDFLEPDLNRNFDEWATKEVWERSRRLASTSGSADVLIDARLILLPDNQKVFLREDSTVLEVSSFLESGLATNRRVQKLNRTPVRDLKRSNLIVLRTAGGGDYVREVADCLMVGCDQDDLRTQAYEWKELLYPFLQDPGTQHLAMLLEKRGFSVSGHRYISVWATEHIIRPEPYSKFLALMEILDKLGCPVACAEQAPRWWTLLERVEGFHRQAGHQIRHDLLEELQHMITSGTSVEMRHSLSLPGVEAGKLELLRVVGVDDQIVRIPAHLTNVVMVE